MNCPDVRACLPDLVYGDLGPAEAAAAEEHLAKCPACRRELAGLRAVRRLLDATPAPPVAVDVGAVYRQSAERQALSARRWRRVACAAAVLLAGVTALAVGLRLEVRVESQQVVVRWGTPPAPAPAPAVPGATEDQLRRMGELVQVLTADSRRRDERQHQEVQLLRRQLSEINDQLVRRWEGAERDLAALYQAQFPARKGIIP
jgi:hypothetical protein